MTEPFEYRGINHLALVCRDMERTVDFYTNVLGMPLIKAIELPFDMGQHFFFDCGGGDSLAFFWFPDAPEPAPGVSAPAGLNAPQASQPARARAAGNDRCLFIRCASGGGFPGCSLLS